MSPAGDMLRLLTNIVKPLRDEGISLPAFQDRVQNDLVSAMCTCLAAIADAVAADKQVEEMTGASVLLARILHFLLGFQGVWTEEVISLSGRLCSVLIRLASVSSA